MIAVLLIAITLIVLLVGSYTDLKTREVPDWLNYGFIFLALGLRTIYSFDYGWKILIDGLLGFAAFFLLALLFYHTNQWGGGDSKLLMGMGAAIGISYQFNQSTLTLLYFLLSLLFIGSIYGLVWLVIIAVRKRDIFMKEAKKKFKDKKTHLYLGIYSLIFFTLASLFSTYLFLGLFPVFIYYLLLFVTTIENSCFIREARVEELTEGEWLAKDVVVDGKKILKKKTLDQKDLEFLAKKVKKVTIKEGLPFVPSFLFAYLFVLFGKDVFNYLLRLVF